jgi:acyl-CoA synthetase (AMP-forming)/AMP-acid ligase II
MVLFKNSFIQALSEAEPATIVLVDKNMRITAGQLLKDSQNLALYLQTCGVQQGQKVVLMIKPGVDFTKIVYANMMLGTVIAILDPEMGADNFRAKFEQLKPDFVFSDSRLLFLSEHPILKFVLRKVGVQIPFLPSLSGVGVFSVGQWLPLLRRHKRLIIKRSEQLAQIDFQDFDTNAPFLITYTSGTLHEPKGVVHTCESLFESISLLAHILKHGENKRIATHLPHFMLIGIQAGLTVYIWDDKSSPNQKIAFIKQHQITTLFGPPSDYMPIVRFLQSAQQNLPESLSTIFLGSAPVYPSFLQQFLPLCSDAKVCILYGLTEHLVTCLQDAREKLQWQGRGDLVGKPQQGVTISIAPDGEIHVASKQLFQEYLGMGLSQRPHPTGDLGYLDFNGSLVLTGRKKDMLIRDNFNLYPGLYEPTINRIKGITEAIIIGVYDLHRETESVVLVVEGDASLTEQGIRNQLVSGSYSIDSQALPDKILFRKLARSGRQKKVDRKQIRIELAEL